MDEIDKKIISDLEKDSRTPFLRIARELKVTEGTIRQRVNKLLENNIIKKFTIESKNDSTAVLGIEISKDILTEEIIKKIKELDIIQIYEVAGDFDIICFLKEKNMDKIKEIVERIKLLKGIGDIKLFPVLREN